MRPFLDTTAPTSTWCFSFDGLGCASAVVAVYQYYSGRAGQQWALLIRRQVTYKRFLQLSPKASRVYAWFVSSLVTPIDEWHHQIQTGINHSVSFLYAYHCSAPSHRPISPGHYLCVLVSGTLTAVLSSSSRSEISLCYDSLTWQTSLSIWLWATGAGHAGSSFRSDQRVRPQSAIA